MRTSQIRSHIEYWIQTYNILVPILYSKRVRNVAALADFNTILWRFVIVAYFFGCHPVYTEHNFNKRWRRAFIIPRRTNGRCGRTCRTPATAPCGSEAGRAATWPERRRPPPTTRCRRRPRRAAISRHPAPASARRRPSLQPSQSHGATSSLYARENIRYAVSARLDTIYIHNFYFPKTGS